MIYLALLRGINVGGNAMIKMADLKDALIKAGLQDVKTYINSGNVIFTSGNKDQDALAEQVSNVIKDSFSLDVKTVVFTAEQWRRIITAAPEWWGKDTSYKHNILVMIKPFEMDEVVAAIGELKPELEQMVAGNGVLYQSISWDHFGRTAAGKMASKPIYKSMTIRNYNTATKLVSLL